MIMVGTPFLRLRVSFGAYYYATEIISSLLFGYGIAKYHKTPYSSSGSSSDSSEFSSEPTSASCTALRAVISISLDPSTFNPFS